MRVVFFGTPEFALPSLRALIGEGFDVAAVVTQPDRPHGRSRSRLVPPPVKQVAIEEDIPVLQPERPRDPAFRGAVTDLRPDIGVVVAYGHILSTNLLAVPRRGMVNVHASILPALRGAAPIQHAILQGLTETGVSVMQMDAGMDTGPVWHAVPTPIAADETAGELSERLAELGAMALVQALQIVALDLAQPVRQDNASATLAPKIPRHDARIEWGLPTREIARRVRAMDPKPGAWSTLDGREVKLFGPTEADRPTGTPSPGEVVEVRPAFIVATGDGAIQFLDAKPAGSRRMAAAEWARGWGTGADRRFT